MAHRQWNDGTSLANKGKNETYINSQKKYEQMSYQQQLIEQKKQEIQKRIEEKKKKETEEALKKLNEDKLKAAESSRSKRSYYGYSKRSGKERPPENVTPTLPANIFKNDGSFLDQFQKLSGIKVEVKKRSTENNNDSGIKNNGSDEKEDGNKVSENTNLGEDTEKKKERRWSSPDRNQNSVNLMQPQTTMPQQINIQIQQPILQMTQQQTLPQVTQQTLQIPQQAQQQIPRQPMPQQQMMFPSQMQMPIPPPMFNPPPQFNHMQMMLPPPMAPSSIPPPAPLNPGSIPSPSPLQPYAIPPPSPLMPHSIPPPSPMVPHSIPPPSPLTPHSIPPPMPLRPQNIPPPMQRPPAFLTVPPPPPPPPPPEEEKHKNEKSPISEADEDTVDRKVNNLFKNEDYSSDEEKSEKRSFYRPQSDRRHSDSDSEYDRKSGSFSNKESDADIFNRVDSLSGLDSERGQESQMGTEEMSQGDRSYIIIEDSQTQFPSDNNGEPAPADLSSTEDSRPGLGLHSGYSSSRDSTSHWQEVKREGFSTNYEKEFGTKYDIFSKSADTKEIKQEVEDVGGEIKTEVKQEALDSNSQDSTTIKTEDPPPRKKRRSRWASSDEKVEMPPVVSVMPSAPPTLPPGPLTMPPRPPGLPGMPPGLPGMPPGLPGMPPRLPGMPPGLSSMPPGLPSMPPGLSSMPPGLSSKPPGLSSMPPGLPSMPPGLPGMLPGLSGMPPRPPVVPPVGMALPKVLGGVVPPVPPSVPTVNVPGMSGSMISKVTRTDPALVAYAMKAFGRTNLTDAEWKKAEDHYKINLLYQDMLHKREELQRLQAAGKNKYEYDSDEETEGGTWEHRLRSLEMEATQRWADELTEAAKGKHHIGDFLPPDELSRFMEKYEALKQGREPDLSDYKEFKLQEDNIGFQMLQKLGWTEGQGLGPEGGGITDPVNKACMRPEGQGLGVERPDDVDADDDEYDAYRKRMMLAYRFRPNPMDNMYCGIATVLSSLLNHTSQWNNPRRPYY